MSRSIQGWRAPLLAGLGVFAVELQVRGQGLDLLEDGLWLLAANTIREGGALYRDLVLRDGPIDAALLRAFFAVFGASAGTLALLKSALDGLAAGLAFGAARRLGAGVWSWWAPLAVLALGPFAPRYVLGLAAALGSSVWLERRNSAPWLGAGVGVLLGLTALSGLDGMAMAAGTWLVLAWALRGDSARVLLRQLAAPALGFALPWGLALFVGVMNLALPAALDQVVVAGLERLAEQLRAIPGAAYVDTLIHARAARSPFSALQTGESLQAVLPAQDLLRDAAFRLRGILLPLLVIFAWTRSRWRAPGSLALLVFASLALLSLLLNGGAPMLDRAWLGGAFLLPAILALLKAPWRRRIALWGFPLLLLGLGLWETGWLATHRHREGLEWWDRPSAGIALDQGQVKQVEALFEAMGGGDAEMLIWPASPGLHFLMGRAPALPQTVLLEGRVRHGERLDEELRNAAPRQVLLGLAWYYGGREIEELAPGVWDQLRSQYWVIGNVREGALRMRVLERVPEGGKLQELSLRQRLPEIEQTVGTGTGPAMRPSLEMGQSFEVGQEDFEGIAVRWHTQQRDLVVPVRVRVWMFRQGHWRNLVRFDDLDLKIPGNLHRSYIRFGPIEETAGRRLLVTLEVREELDYDLRLIWHRRDNDPSAPDFYPEGSAMVEWESENADLYFLTW